MTRRSAWFFRLVGILVLGVLMWGAWGHRAIARAQGTCPVPTTYTVQPGDALSLIAERLGIDAETLIRLNHITDPDHIEVGQVLRLPCPIHAHDQALAAVEAGMATGIGLPSLPHAEGWVGLWQARAAMYTRLRASHVPVRVYWRPPAVYPGDTVVMHVSPSSSSLVTPTVRVVDHWVPLEKVGDGYAGFVPLHALVQPGILNISLAITASHNLSTTLEAPVWVQAKDFPHQDIYIPQAKSGLLAKEVIQEEYSRLMKVWLASAGPPLWSGPFAWPIDITQWPTTAPYGIRRTYNPGGLHGYHTGQDIAAPEGTPVYAPARGRVVLAGPLQVRGNVVVLDHGAGVTSNYWHLSRVDVNVGQMVERGDPLGLVGTTGLSTGAHLHWEIRVYGIPVNPVPWTHKDGPASGF